MTTFWTYPNEISQYAEEGAESVHIAWNNNIENIISNDKLSIITEKNLYHISRSPKHDLVTKTYYLKLKNFQFQNVPLTISGIELRLTTNRRGRIMDDTIQLVYNDQIIGNNKSITEVNNTMIYGSATDKWNTNLTHEEVSNKNFGLLLRFKSHIKYPHSDPMFVNCVEMRIH